MHFHQRHVYLKITFAAYRLLSPAGTVAKFAADAISPRVRDMDDNSAMDTELISQIFENGLMGVEVPEEYGGGSLVSNQSQLFWGTVHSSNPNP